MVLIRADEDDGALGWRPCARSLARGRSWRDQAQHRHQAVGACGGATPSSAPTTASLASDTQPIVSTGRWGCGVFGGLPAHKFTQQVLAARLAGVSLRFSTFGSPDGCDEVLDAMHKANGTSISEVWAVLLDCNQRETFQRAFCDGLTELAAFNQGQVAPMSSSEDQSSAQHTV